MVRLSCVFTVDNPEGVADMIINKCSDAYPRDLPSGLAIWSASQVCSRLGIARSQYYRMLARGELPPRVQLSTARFGHRVADIERWVADRIQEVA